MDRDRKAMSLTYHLLGWSFWVLLPVALSWHVAWWLGLVWVAANAWLMVWFLKHMDRGQSDP